MMLKKILFSLISLFISTASSGDAQELAVMKCASRKTRPTNRGLRQLTGIF